MIANSAEVRELTKQMTNHLFSFTEEVWEVVDAPEEHKIQATYSLSAYILGMALQVYIETLGDSSIALPALIAEFEKGRDLIKSQV